MIDCIYHQDTMYMSNLEVGLNQGRRDAAVFRFIRPYIFNRLTVSPYQLAKEKMLQSFLESSLAKKLLFRKFSVVGEPPGLIMSQFVFIGPDKCTRKFKQSLHHRLAAVF